MYTFVDLTRLFLRPKITCWLEWAIVVVLGMTVLFYAMLKLPIMLLLLLLLLLMMMMMNGFREDQDRVAQKWMEEQTKYEDAHMGNFRRIYPSEDSEKYERFFHSSGSLYQETASFKARSECARSVSLFLRQSVWATG